jgi:hypothetical protein
MSSERPHVEALRIDVTGDSATLELVERLRWAKPRVTPLEAHGWRVSIPCGTDHERVLEAIRAWLRTQELPDATVWVQGTPHTVDAAA